MLWMTSSKWQELIVSCRNLASLEEQLISAINRWRKEVADLGLELDEMCNKLNDVPVEVRRFLIELLAIGSNDYKTKYADTNAITKSVVDIVNTIQQSSKEVMNVANQLEKYYNQALKAESASK